MFKFKYYNFHLTGEAIIRQNDQGAEWEYSGKFEGDIILDDEQIEAMVEEYATGNNAYIIANSRWPQNTVIYQWTAGVFSKFIQISHITPISPDILFDFNCKKKFSTSFL